MTTAARTTYADAQTLASVERADHLIAPIVAFIGGAVRGGVTTLLALATLIVVGLAVQRIDTLTQSPLIDLAAVAAFASLASVVVAFLPSSRKAGQRG